MPPASGETLARQELQPPTTPSVLAAATAPTDPTDPTDAAVDAKHPVPAATNEPQVEEEAPATRQDAPATAEKAPAIAEGQSHRGLPQQALDAADEAPTAAKEAPAAAEEAPAAAKEAISGRLCGAGDGLKRVATEEDRIECPQLPMDARAAETVSVGHTDAFWDALGSVAAEAEGLKCLQLLCALCADGALETDPPPRQIDATASAGSGRPPVAGTDPEPGTFAAFRFGGGGAIDGSGTDTDTDTDRGAGAENGVGVGVVGVVEEDDDTPAAAPESPARHGARGRRVTVSAQVYEVAAEVATFQPVVHAKSEQDRAVSSLPSPNPTP